MWRVSSERIRLDLDGPSVEVEPLRSWMIQTECLLLAQRLKDADEGAAEYVALTNLFEFVVREAQPQWDIVDHLGAVPATARGMARLPVALALEICDEWTATLDARPERDAIPGLRLVESDAASAVDAVVPAGPLRREIKRRLRKAA